MVMRERMTLAVVLVLIAVGGWFTAVVMERGLGAPLGPEFLTAVIACAVLTAVAGGIAGAVGRDKGRQVDERDTRLTLKAQVLRGYLYLILGFGVLGIALAEGQHALANGMFLAIVGIEVLSGLVMLALYRFSG